MEQAQSLKLNVTNIHKFLVGSNKQLAKLRKEKKNLLFKYEKQAQSRQKEKKIEARDFGVGRGIKKVASAVARPAMSFFDKIKEFFGVLLLGLLINNLPFIISKLKEFFNSDFIKGVKATLKVFYQIGKFLFDVTSILSSNAMRVFDNEKKWIEGELGRVGNLVDGTIQFFTGLFSNQQSPNASSNFTGGSIPRSSSSQGSSPVIPNAGGSSANPPSPIMPPVQRRAPGGTITGSSSPVSQTNYTHSEGTSSGEGLGVFKTFKNSIFSLDKVIKGPGKENVGLLEDIEDLTKPKIGKDAASVSPLFRYPERPSTSKSSPSVILPGQGGSIIEYLTGDINHPNFEYGGHGTVDNYHDHFAFSTAEERDRAIRVLESNGIVVGSRTRVGDPGYHGQGLAIDVPGSQWGGAGAIGPVEYNGSARVRKILQDNGFFGSGVPRVEPKQNQPSVKPVAKTKQVSSASGGFGTREVMFVYAIQPQVEYVPMPYPVPVRQPSMTQNTQPPKPSALWRA